jgi:NTE family protein
MIVGAEFLLTIVISFFILKQKEDLVLSQQIPKEQRALVMQGGGALGAYEAGVFKALYDKFIEPNNQGFDIVAGVSIGAVNATILVNHAIKKKGWHDSAKTLYNFWDDLSARPEFFNPVSWGLYWIDNPLSTAWFTYQGFFRETFSKFYESSQKTIKTLWKQDWPYILVWNRENWPFFQWASWKGEEDPNWKEELPYSWAYFWWPDKLGPVASPEAARRYYSWRYFMLTGTPNVYTPIIPQLDFEFFDLWYPYSILFRLGNAPLKRTIKNYWLPDASHIKTSLDAEEPRLLLVSTDVQNCASVTFDSYEKSDDEYGKAECRTVYGEEKTKYVIEYSEGIGMEHLDTSMAFHQRHRYPTLMVKKHSSGGHREERPFWDGIYLSNTPLREVIQAHRDYWFRVRGLKEDIPKLKVYIVDLYPIEEKGIPEGFDEITDRQYDLLFSDKTRYDEKIAHMVTDYIKLNKRMKDNLIGAAADFVKDPNEKQKLKRKLTQEYDNILNMEQARSRSRDGKYRTYRDLLEGHFEVEVFRIERSEDKEEKRSRQIETDIYGKAFDFSSKTIEELRREGENDTLKQINFPTNDPRKITW